MEFRTAAVAHRCEESKAGSRWETHVGADARGREFPTLHHEIKKGAKAVEAVVAGQRLAMLEEHLAAGDGIANEDAKARVLSGLAQSG